MTYDEVTHEIVLECTGRRAVCNIGVLGMNIDGDALSPTYGFDGELSPNRQDGRIVGGPDFGPLERREIADHMIGLWTRWAHA